MDVFLYISLALILYVLLLITLKKLNFWRKEKCNNCTNCCPECKEPLERVRRTNIDYFINYITFQIFDFKRYRCIYCAWEGRRWEKAFNGKF